MFRLKYKMHRFVNIIFYFLIFAVGFLLGGGNFEKVINMFKSIL